MERFSTYDIRASLFHLASGNKLHSFVYFSQDVRGNRTGERSFGVEDAISCSTVAIKRHLSHSRLLVVSTIHAAVLDRSWPAGHAVGHAPRGLVAQARIRKH